MLILLIRRYATAAWRHRWLALLVAWAVSIGGWIAVSRIPETYVANARVFADADAVLGQTLRGIAVDGATAAQVDLLTRTLLARPNIERVVSRTDLDLRVSSVAERDALVAQLARDIRVVPQSRSLFRIEYRDQDPRVAHAVVQTLLDLFIERAAANDRAQMENARQFVQQQIAGYETQLRDAERRRAEFRTRYFDLLPNDNLGGSNRLESARTRLINLRGELEDANTRRNILVQQRDSMPEFLRPEQTVTSGGGGGGGGRAAEIERQIRELRLRYTDNHPEIVTLQRILADLRAGGGGGGGGGGAGGAARAATTTTVPAQPNPAREALQSRIVDADVNIASLERQIRTVQTEVERLEALARTAPQLLAQVTNMDRDYQVLRRQYEELLERREALQIAGAARTGADQVRLEVVEPPTVPTRSTGPNRPLLYTAALGAGLAAGIAIAGLLTLLDRGFYTLRDLRSLGLPVLGAISALTPRRRAGSIAVFATLLLALLASYGAVLWRGPEIVARLPGLVARFMA